MKQFILVLAMIGMLTNVYSQSTLLWTRDFTAGLSNYYVEYPRFQTDSDTITVIGRINTAIGQRLLIVKYNLLGDTISTSSYGSDSVLNNSIIDYKFDTTNHVYILNKEQLGFYKSKIVIQKYSLDGTLIWVEQIQNLADTSYAPRSLGLANDTCLFIAAYKEYDYPEPGDDVIFTSTHPQLFAYNSNGNQLWQREFNPSTEIYWFAYDIFVYNNTAFLFANNTSFINRLVKVDINNNFTINTNTGLLNGMNDVQLTPDSNLLITAWSRYRISKANLSGSVIWTQIFGTNLPSNVSGDEMKATVQDSIGNIYITGRHYGLNYGTPSYTNADILTLKYNSNGNLIWQSRYEYGIHNADIGNVIILKNGQIYVGGNSQRVGVMIDYDYVVLKIDSATGQLTGSYRYDGLASGNDAVSSLFVFDNGNVALTGLSYINGQYDWTTQLLADLVLSVPNVSLSSNLLIYPNPIACSEILTIVGKHIKSYSIISAIGQIVQQGTFEANDLQTIHIDNIKTGIYLISIITDYGVVTRKLSVK
ncbi:MAG: T9SS type A sorting domain-containing protein [Bacteroidetes bacterium]|nr:T9SS type A sorting domain-containing protein [Bacteroidota bacterium]